MSNLMDIKDFNSLTPEELQELLAKYDNASKNAFKIDAELSSSSESKPRKTSSRNKSPLLQMRDMMNSGKITQEQLLALLTDAQKGANDGE